jgi:hypothetical protein
MWYALAEVDDNHKELAVSCAAARPAGRLLFDHCFLVLGFTLLGEVPWGQD